MNVMTRPLSAPLTMFALCACAESDSEFASGLTPDRTDRKGLVEFAVPSGWNNDESGSGRHFRRENPEENQAIIYIDALQRPASLKIDVVWEQTKGKHKIQDQVLTQENSSMLNGFELREAIYQANVRDQDVMYHDVFLFTDDLQIEMSLNAAADVYDGYVGDFRATVGSVRPKTSGE